MTEQEALAIARKIDPNPRMTHNSLRDHGIFVFKGEYVDIDISNKSVFLRDWWLNSNAGAVFKLGDPDLFEKCEHWICKREHKWNSK